MITINSRIIYSVNLFILLMALVYVSKPNIMFEKNDAIRKFGINQKETILSLGVFTVLASILSFYIFSMIDLIFNWKYNVCYC